MIVAVLQRTAPIIFLTRLVTKAISLALAQDSRLQINSLYSLQITRRDST